MRVINIEYEQQYPRTYQTGIKIVIESDIDTWWVSQDEIISVYPIHYLDHYNLNTILIGGMKVFGWHTNPNGIQIKNIVP
jgi:hypothetical protein